MKVRGVYTLEAVFIVSISIWILVALCYGGMYVHDRVVMESVTNEETASWLSRSGAQSEQEWRTALEKKLEQNLLILRVHSVQTTKKLQSQKVQVRYSVPVSWTLLKKIWSGNKNTVVYETEREDVVPAKYKWDASIVDTEKG